MHMMKVGEGGLYSTPFQALCPSPLLLSRRETLNEAGNVIACDKNVSNE